MKCDEAIWQLDLWHMATDAVCARHGTCLCIGMTTAGRGCIPGCMTGQTLRVVKAVGRYKVLVRIMAGNAADTGIGTIKALAVGQAEGLKANVHLASPAASHHRLPGAVTLPAEIREVFTGELFQVRRWRVEFSALRRNHVRGGAGMAMLAGYTGFDGLEG